MVEGGLSTQLGSLLGTESALEGKSPYLLVIVIYSSLPPFSTSGVTEERQLPANNKSHFETSLFLEFCDASVVIRHSVKWDKDKTKSVS